jgi:hypothetical protein
MDIHVMFIKSTDWFVSVLSFMGIVADYWIFKLTNAGGGYRIIGRTCAELFTYSSVVIAEGRQMPLLLIGSEGGHFLIETVHVIPEDVRVNEVAVRVYEMCDGHHGITVPVRILLRQHSLGNQVLVPCPDESRPDKGQVEVPILAW